MHVCCALFVLAELLSIAQGPGAPKTLALKVLHEGDPAPAVPGATIKLLYLPPQIDAAGNVLVDAFLQGPGITSANDYAFYYGPPGALQVIAREGDPAPDLPGLTLANLLYGVLEVSEDGWLCYGSLLSGPGVIKEYNDLAAFVGAPGDIRLLARTGDPAPGLEADGTILAWKSGFGALLSDNHTVLLHTDLAGPKIDETNDRATYVGTREELKLVWRKGMPAPGTEAGTVFTWAQSTQFNDAGQIAFEGSLAGPAIIKDVNDKGLWVGAVDDLKLVARDGDPVPGFADGVTYRFAVATWGKINAGGESCGEALLEGPGIGDTNDGIVYVGAAYPFTVLAQEGDPAPEAGEGVELDGVSSAAANACGEIFYVAKYRGSSIDDTNRWGMYFGPYEGAQLSLRDGDGAPWLAPGIVLSKVGAMLTQSALNDAGDVVGPSELVGSTVTPQDKVALWFRAGVPGQWFPLLRSGLSLAGRVVWASDVSDLGKGYCNKTGGSDGQPQSLDDSAELATRIKFVDATQGAYRLQVVWPGDMNCDGATDAFDIDPFVLALIDGAGYVSQYPYCSLSHADVNGDGKIDAFDVDPFVKLLVSVP